MRVKNCWACGMKLEPDEAPVIVGKHAYCDASCATDGERGDPREPIDYDAQDRNAAASERIANFFAER